MILNHLVESSVLRRVKAHLMVVTVLGSGCSLITNAEVAQCTSDEQCGALGIQNATCDLTAQVCVSPVEPTTSQAPTTNVPQSAGGAPSAPEIPEKAAQGQGGASSEGGFAGAAGTTSTTGGGGIGGAGGTDKPDAGPTVCTPRTEVCNSLDDDCDGRIDNGCPSGTTWSSVEERKAIGDSWGGAYFGDQCAAGEVLTGIKTRMGSWLDQVAGICQKLGIKTDTQKSPHTYSLELSGKTTLPAHPNSTSAVWELTCPSGRILVGLRVAEQNYNLDGAPANVVFTRLWLNCAEPYLVQSAGAAPQIKWKNAAEIGPASGASADNTAWFASDKIPDGFVAVRLHGMAGSWLDRIGLGVSSPTVVLK